ncbi:MAG: hypothetical protein ACYC9Q_00405 [Bacillota bacterium]
MLTRDQFRKVYERLDQVTPLREDCGLLCSRQCCAEWEKGAGMYLLPGEEVMFTRDEDWLRWEVHSTDEYEFCPAWHGDFFFVACTKPCPRDRRPFACRTFPLAPYLTPDGRLTILFDDNGILICPLVREGRLERLDPRFVKAARQAWEILLTDGLIRADVEWQSRQRDVTGSGWTRLFRGL